MALHRPWCNIPVFFKTWLSSPPDMVRGWRSAKGVRESLSGLFIYTSGCVRTACLTSKETSVWFGFSFLFSDSTLSANRPVASPFIWESSCFWTKPSLLMQRDLSALLCVHPLLCEIWHDRSYRGFKPPFVTLLTQQKMRDFDFRLPVEYLCNSLAPLVESTEFIHDLNNMYTFSFFSNCANIKMLQITQYLYSRVLHTTEKMILPHSWSPLVAFPLNLKAGKWESQRWSHYKSKSKVPCNPASVIKCQCRALPVSTAEAGFHVCLYALPLGWKLRK